MANDRGGYDHSQQRQEQQDSQLHSKIDRQTDRQADRKTDPETEFRAINIGKKGSQEVQPVISILTDTIRTDVTDMQTSAGAEEHQLHTASSSRTLHGHAASRGLTNDFNVRTIAINY